MHSMEGWCLNLDVTTSLRLGHTPISQESTSTLHRCNSVRAHQYAHPWHIKVLTYFLYI